MRNNEESPFRIALGDAVRVHGECCAGLAALLHGKEIMVEGKKCKVIVTRSDDEIVAEVLEPTNNLPRLQFRMIYTGRWGEDGSNK